MRPYTEKIKSQSEIETIAKELKSNGKKVVFTNGCFDILHLGHVRYLTQAKSKGDVLIIGLNSDKSVKRLKEGGRPINGQIARSEVIASLEFVDYVIIFEEDTPLELIKKINPDILIKGGDWDIKDIVGSEHVSFYGGTTTTIPFLEGFSTTEIINKIKQDK